MLRAAQAGLVWLLLFPTIFYVSNTSAIPEISLCQESDQLSGRQAAHYYHLNCADGYHISYFDINLEKLSTLQLGSWYFNRITQMYEDSSNSLYLSQNLTEVQVFARHFSNDGAFECNILNPLCNREANPRRIINHLQMLHPEYEPKELMEEALKVKFALDLIVTINRIHNAVYELFKVVQTNEGQLSGWIIQWFTTQKKRRSEEYCKFKEKILAWGVGFVENLACFAWGFVPTDGGSRAAGAAISGVSNLLQSYFALIQLEVEMAVLQQQLDVDEEWENAKQNATGELMLDIPYAVGVCGSIGGNYEAENWNKQGTMEHYIQDLFIKMRQEVETSLNTLMGNWKKGQRHGRIAGYLGRPQAYQWYDRLKRGLTLYEGNMTTHFLQVLESASMTSDKCYVECIENIHETRKPEKCNPKSWWNEESRYCPPDEEHVTCQLECLTLQDKGNHLRAPSGVEKVKEKHGIGQMKIAEESWRKFRANGHSNAYETPDKRLSKGIVSLDMTLSSGRPLYSLPVSFSRHGKITEFEDTIEVEELDFKGKDRNAQFPCITGDWTGSGNAEFLKRLNLGPNTKEASKSGELSERLCPFITRKEAPATHYFMTCRWGVQYPRKDFSGRPFADFYYKLGNGPSGHCEDLLKSVERMTEVQGNWMFCKNSTVAKKVMDGEIIDAGRVLDPIEDSPWLGHNHRWRCKKWLGEHTKEFKNVTSVWDIKW